jgi:hypothetical protein
MSTINDRAMVDQIIVNDGAYADDPLIIKIVEYTNAWGGQAYGLIYNQRDWNKYDASPYVINPKTLWSAK